jgi:hypothetical protein
LGLLACGDAYARMVPSEEWLLKEAYESRDALLLKEVRPINLQIFLNINPLYRSYAFAEQKINIVLLIVRAIKFKTASRRLGV